MDDLETMVRDELHRAVSHVEVRPDLWDKIRSRHRREPRRRMFELATSLAVLALVAAVALPFARGLVERPPTPTGDDIQLLDGSEPVGSPEQAPESWWAILGFSAPDLPPSGPPVPLARDGDDGQDWTFVAYPAGVERDTACYGFFESPDMTPGPGRCIDVPEQVSLPEVYAPAGIAFGYARKDAARVEVTLHDGRSLDARLLPYSEDLPFRFYLVTGPDGTGLASDMIRQAVVYNDAGQEVGRSREVVPGEQESPFAGLEPATGPVHSVATGEFDGEPWELIAHAYSEGVCYGFNPANTIGGVASCDPSEGMPSNGAVSAAVNGGPNMPTFVYGVVVKEATVVRVEFPDGEVQEVRPSGQGEGFEVNFYALVVPGVGAPSVEVTAFDAAGDELEPPPESPAPEPSSAPLGLKPATGPIVSLDSGEIDGMPWEFAAHRWQEGICFGFLQDAPGMTGGGAFCDPSRPGSPVGIGVNGDSGAGQPSFVWGAMPADAELIRIELPDGQTLDVPPLGQQEFGVSFFVRALPAGTPVDGVKASVRATDGTEPRPGPESPLPTTTNPNG